MNKSVFFRSLSLLGLAFVLMGCGAPETEEKTPEGGVHGDAPGEGAAEKGLGIGEVEEKIYELMRKTKGRVDLKNAYSVATKFVSIVKASQPIGSCSLFNQSIFGVDKDKPGAGTWGTEGKKPKYETQGAEYPGGSGSLTVTAATAAGADLAADGVIATADIITYKYDKYSIDGIYFLDGELKMKPGTATAKDTPTVSDFTAEAGSELKLSEVPATGGDAKDIATIDFAATFKPVFVSGAAATGCGSVYEMAGTHAKVDGVTVKKAGTAGFTELKLEQTAAGEATKYPAGATAGLAMALIGPRWYK